MDGGPFLQKQFYSASGGWGAQPGGIVEAAFFASDVVTPDRGWSANALLTERPDGGLTGQLVYFLDSACLQVTCEAIEITGQQSHFAVELAPTTGSPAPVPLPPALGLLLAAIGGLVGASRLRRGEPVVRKHNCPRRAGRGRRAGAARARRGVWCGFRAE